MNGSRSRCFLHYVMHPAFPSDMPAKMVAMQGSADLVNHTSPSNVCLACFQATSARQLRPVVSHGLRGICALCRRVAVGIDDLPDSAIQLIAQHIPRFFQRCEPRSSAVQVLPIGSTFHQALESCICNLVVYRASSYAG